MSQTAAPVELDDIYAALDQLNVALGPKGVNAASGGAGPLSQLIDVGAANLDGNGTALGRPCATCPRRCRRCRGRQDLFGTVKNLQVFTDALAANDAQVREFNAQLDQVSEPWPKSGGPGRRAEAPQRCARDIAASSRPPATASMPTSSG